MAIDLTFQTPDEFAVSLGDAGELPVDFTKLGAAGPAVLAYVFKYGLKQMLNDVHAGVTARVEPDATKRAAAKRALAEKKLDSLYRGEVAQARSGGAGSALERELRAVAVDALKPAVAGAGFAWGRLTPAQRDALVAKWLAANAETARRAAEERIAARAALAKGEVDIASLLGTPEA